MATHIGPVKDRLLIVLGAGSTVHAGAPTTAEISRRVGQSSDPTVASVVRALTAQRGKAGWGFETVLAVLEELDEFVLRKQAPGICDRASGLLSGFADLHPSIAPPAGSSFLSVRVGFVNGLHRFLMERARLSDTARMRGFFRILLEEFDLTVVTLNYDDVVDRAGEWFDGFGPLGGDDDPAFFDVEEWLQRANSAASVLIHLHGSMRFGFATRPLGQAPEVAKYRTAANAWCSLGCDWEEMRGGGADGRPLEMPLISGQRKDRTMTYGAAPFPFLYNVFVNVALSCSRVLVAGYGGHDAHISHWLLHGVAARVHGPRWRVVKLWLQTLRPRAAA